MLLRRRQQRQANIVPGEALRIKLALCNPPMAAYAHLQHIDMQSRERTAITEALLRYCELDTLTMVIVVETWQDMLRH